MVDKVTPDINELLWGITVYRLKVLYQVRVLILG